MIECSRLASQRTLKNHQQNDPLQTSLLAAVAGEVFSTSISCHRRKRLRANDRRPVVTKFGPKQTTLEPELLPPLPLRVPVFISSEHLLQLPSSDRCKVTLRVDPRCGRSSVQLRNCNFRRTDVEQPAHSFILEIE